MKVDRFWIRERSQARSAQPAAPPTHLKPTDLVLSQPQFFEKRELFQIFDNLQQQQVTLVIPLGKTESTHANAVPAQLQALQRISRPIQLSGFDLRNLVLHEVNCMDMFLRRE